MHYFVDLVSWVAWRFSPNLCLSGFDCFPELVKLQACAILSAALTATNSRGLVVGHTPQTIGANWYDLFSCFCDTSFLLAFIVTLIYCSGACQQCQSLKTVLFDLLTELQKIHEILADIKFFLGCCISPCFPEEKSIISMEIRGMEFGKWIDWFAIAFMQQVWWKNLANRCWHVQWSPPCTTWGMHVPLSSMWKAIVSVSSVSLHCTFLFCIVLGAARSIASERFTTLMMVNGVTNHGQHYTVAHIIHHHAWK